MNRLQVIACAGAVASLVAVIGAPRGVAGHTAIDTSTSFEVRVDQYMRLRRSLTADVLLHHAEASPDDVEFRQALADALRRARRKANTGDVFGPVISSRVMMLVRLDLASRDSESRREVLSEVPPVATVRVNDAYPTDAPLASMPPLVLQHLDRLPPELQYRFLGTALILLDVDTGVIVDVVPRVTEGTV